MQANCYTLWKRCVSRYTKPLNCILYRSAWNLEASLAFYVWTVKVSHLLEIFANKQQGSRGGIWSPKGRSNVSQWQPPAKVMFLADPVVQQSSSERKLFLRHHSVYTIRYFCMVPILYNIFWYPLSPSPLYPWKSMLSATWYLGPLCSSCLFFCVSSQQEMQRQTGLPDRPEPGFWSPWAPPAGGI